MDKSNLELLKEAISEGVSRRFDRMAAEYTEEIVCSDKHTLAMRTIVYGKAETKRPWSPRTRRIIAILIAAALLLTSCGIIFRNEIREMINEFFIMLSFDGDEAATIDEVYELGYVPEGYQLEKEIINPLSTRYTFKNNKDDYIWFEQRTIDGTNFYVDNEKGYVKIDTIQSYEIFYRYYNEKHVYVWNDGEYSLFIQSTIELPDSEIILIIEGLTTK
ncbi:MAG: DUF4367 domain-containing protein [Clostridia bacterium]|nr:DUF4367 domain-containing protein [Clostridia bacterium]